MTIQSQRSLYDTRRSLIEFAKQGAPMLPEERRYHRGHGYIRASAGRLASLVDSREAAVALQKQIKLDNPRFDMRSSAFVHPLSNAGQLTGEWEFRGPDKFRWQGPATSAYDARHRGWLAWLAR